MNKIVIGVVLLVLYFLSWIAVRLMCDYKYVICKRNCEKCGCWNCKFYHDSN